MIVALGFALVVAVAASLEGPMQVAAAKSEKMNSTTRPLVRSDPGVVPWVERDIPPPKPKVVTEPAGDLQPASVPKPDKRPVPSGPRPEQQTGTLPREEGYPLPTEGQVHAAHHRRYDPPPGAIMSLSVPAIGLRNAPVFDSEAKSVLDKGVAHLPDTSMPWSDTPERNVYLAGHRLGWPGTGSHLIFYRLERARRGGEDHPSRPRGQNLQLQGNRELRRWPRSELGNGQGKGPRPADATDVHTDTHLPAAPHRPRRANLTVRSTLAFGSLSARFGFASACRHARASALACQHGTSLRSAPCQEVVSGRRHEHRTLPPWAAIRCTPQSEA